MSILADLVSTVQSSAGQVMERCQHEASTLLAGRLEADMTLIGQLAAARSPGDLVVACTDFISDAASDYSAAIGRMIKLEIEEAAVVSNAATGDDLRDVALSAQIVA